MTTLIYIQYSANCRLSVIIFRIFHEILESVGIACVDLTSSRKDRHVGKCMEMNISVCGKI